MRPFFKRGRVGGRAGDLNRAGKNESLGLRATRERFLALSFARPSRHTCTGGQTPEKNSFFSLTCVHWQWSMIVIVRWQVRYWWRRWVCIVCVRVSTCGCGPHVRACTRSGTGLVCRDWMESVCGNHKCGILVRYSVTFATTTMAVRVFALAQPPGVRRRMAQQGRKEVVCMS